MTSLTSRSFEPSSPPSAACRAMVRASFNTISCACSTREICTGASSRPLGARGMSVLSATSGAIATSGEHLCKFNQIAERVGEERKLATDGRQDEWLGHDHDAAQSKRRDRGIHAGDVETEMVVAAIFQTIAEIRIGAYFRGTRVAAAEH